MLLKLGSFDFRALLLANGLVLLLAMPLCGMNGTVPSLLVSAGLLAAMRWIQPEERPGRIACALLVRTFLTAAATLLLWRPSPAAAARAGFDLAGTASGFVALLSPSIMRSPVSWAGAPLLLAPIILSWRVVSIAMPRQVVVVAGVLLVGIYSQFYMANLDWRRSHGQQRLYLYVALAVQADLFGRSSIERFAVEHIDEFFFIDTPHAVTATTQGIRRLHREGIAPYDLLADE